MSQPYPSALEISEKEVRNLPWSVLNSGNPKTAEQQTRSEDDTDRWSLGLEINLRQAADDLVILLQCPFLILQLDSPLFGEVSLHVTLRILCLMR